MKYAVSVQIVLNFTVPVEADTEDDAAEKVENMGNAILDHATVRRGGVWVNSAEPMVAS